MANLYSESDVPLDVRHDGQVAYVLLPGLNADVPDLLAGFARAQYPSLVSRVSASPKAVPANDQQAQEDALPVSDGLAADVEIAPAETQPDHGDESVPASNDVTEDASKPKRRKGRTH